MSPRESIALECDRRGKEHLVAGCIELLRGRTVDDELVLALGGPPAARAVTGDLQPYWLRVWAARGLLWAWDDVALEALTDALDDETWRVREMALKVVARHRLHDTLTSVAYLGDDPVPRVRAAAFRAMVRLSGRDEADVDPAAGDPAAGDPAAVDPGPADPG
jgi:HEAT repeats